MSGSDELKNMLLTFRVSELQMLLGYAGLNKTGRKTELQARAVELLKNKSVPHLTQIHAKIRELYKTIQQGGSVHQAQAQQQAVEAALGGGGGVGGLGPAQRPIMPPQPQSAAPISGFIPLSSRASIYGSMYSYPPKVSTQSPVYPIQPDVRLKRLPFYDVLGELLKPSSLVNKYVLVPSGNGRAQEGSFIFYLTPQQASDVSINREVGLGTKNDYLVQIQLRFCLLETSCEQEDVFPPGVIVKVNGKVCPLPNPIPTNKPGVEPKRPPRPVNISSLVKLSPSVANHINVSWSADYTRGYVIAINLVRRLTAADLLQRLKAKGIRHADFTTGLIKEKLSEDADNEIATTSLRVSLLCPLGKMRMTNPSRSTTCTHLQCFDASLFLQMNEKKATWTCPVCDRAALYDNLVIDGYFQDVLNSNRLFPDSHEIQLHQDGTWSSHVAKKESCLLSSPTKGGTQGISKSEPIEEIIDDSDDPPPPVVKQSPPPEDVSGTIADQQPPGAEKKKDIIVVDLTLSDGEDDDKQEHQQRPSCALQLPTNMPPVIQPPTRPCLMRSELDLLSVLSPSGGGSPNIIMLDSPSPPPSVPSPPLQQLAPAELVAPPPPMPPAPAGTPTGLPPNLYNIPPSVLTPTPPPPVTTPPQPPMVPSGVTAFPINPYPRMSTQYDSRWSNGFSVNMREIQLNKKLIKKMKKKRYRNRHQESIKHLLKHGMLAKTDFMNLVDLKKFLDRETKLRRRKGL